MDADLIANLPIENIINIISQKSNVFEIDELCKSSDKLKNICKDQNNLNQIIELILIRIGFDNDEIQKFNKSKLKLVYEIISKSNPNFNETSHHEMLVLSLLKGDDEVINFFKNYFFIGDKRGKYKKDDIRLMSNLAEQFLREMILNNQSWDGKILKMTDIKGNFYTLIPKLSEVNLIAAISRGDISDALNILEMAEENGTPFNDDILLYLNLAGNNMDMLEELLNYSFSNDYFINLDSFQEDLIDKINNPEAKKVVKNFLINLGYFEPESEEQQSEPQEVKSESQEQQSEPQEVKSESEEQQESDIQSEPELSEKRLIEAIKNGDISVVVDILDLAEEEGVPFFHEMVSYINEAGNNENMIKELLSYSFEHDYFISFDSLQDDLINQIQNQESQKFIKQWLIENNYLQEEPKVKAPKVQAPKVQAPKVEEPKVEEPKVEELKVPKVLNLQELTNSNIDLLPIEMVLETMKTLNPDDIANLCSTNKKFVKFCKDNWDYIVKNVILNAGYPELPKDSLLKYTDIYKVIQKGDKELELLAHSKLQLEPYGELNKYFYDYTGYPDLDLDEVDQVVNKIVCKKMLKGEYVPLFKVKEKDTILDPKDIPDLVEYIKNKVDKEESYEFITAFTESLYYFSEDCAKKSGIVDNLKQFRQFNDYFQNRPYSGVIHPETKKFIKGREQRKPMYTSDKITTLYDELRFVTEGVNKTGNSEMLNYILSQYNFEKKEDEEFLERIYGMIKYELKNLGVYDKYNDIISKYITVPKDKDDEYEEKAIEFIKKGDIQNLKKMKKAFKRDNISMKRLHHYAKMVNANQEIIEFLIESDPNYPLYPEIYNL
jgi:hypothetical protein